MNTKVAFLGGVAGVLTGYFLAKQTLDKKYEDRLHNELEEIKEYYNERVDSEVQKAVLYYSKKAEDEIQQVKNFHAKLLAEVSVPDPGELLEGQEAADEIQEVLEEYRGVGKTTSGAGQTKNLIDNFDTDEDLPPYVIPVGMFVDGNPKYKQATLVYYEGDNKLIDQHGKPLVLDKVELEKTIGSENLKKFGEQSKEADVVYVRCEEYQYDFEIIRKKEKFSEIAGDDA